MTTSAAPSVILIKTKPEAQQEESERTTVSPSLGLQPLLCAQPQPLLFPASSSCPRAKPPNPLPPSLPPVARPIHPPAMTLGSSGAGSSVVGKVTWPTFFFSPSAVDLISRSDPVFGLPCAGRACPDLRPGWYDSTMAGEECMCGAIVRVRLDGLFYWILYRG